MKTFRGTAYLERGRREKEEILREMDTVDPGRDYLVIKIPSPIKARGGKFI